jgi:putative flippase GtrA
MFKKHISRFIFVGILNLILSYGVYFILLYLNIYYIFALLISSVIGIAHSFIWNKKWTFKSKGDVRKESIRFISVYGFAFLINLLILALFVEKLMFNPKIAQLFALGVVTIISFYGHKYWSFRL